MGVFITPKATTAQRMSIVPAQGELIYDTDLNTLFEGDGVTLGGITLKGDQGIQGIPGDPGVLNTFTTVAVTGHTDIVAEQPGDTLTLAAGTNVTLSTDPVTDTVTISAGYTLPDGSVTAAKLNAADAGNIRTTLGLGSAALVATSAFATADQGVLAASALQPTAIGVTVQSATVTQSGTGAIARPVSDKLRERVSVKDFGAVGDGVTDNTTALQAAIDAMDDGAILYVPYGVYAHSGTLTISKTLRLEGPGAKGAQLRYTGSTIAILRANEAENGITNGFDAYDIDFQLANPAADVTLLEIHGGNSFCRFTQCRFGQAEERTTAFTLAGVSGAFAAGETITGGTSGATAVISAVTDATHLKVLEDNRRFAVGETITGGTSGATATASALARPGRTIGVKFVGNSDPTTIRPSVYGMFDQCEFVNLKFGVKAQACSYKKFNETVFLNTSFQYCDYGVFDGQQASGVKFFGGGIEIWKKTGVYSDGDNLKIFGTRFERGGIATEATYVPSFIYTDVTTASDTITITGHAFVNGDEVVLESPRDTTDRDLVVWPAGLTPGELYYIVNAATNTVKLSTSPGGAAIDITTQGTSGKTYYLRRLSNIPWQFGKNSDAMAAHSPLINVSGGPEKFRSDGTNWTYLLSTAGRATLVPLPIRASQTVSGAVTIDADAADYHVVNTSGNITSVTINGGAGNQEITIRFAYTGAHTVALSSASILLAGQAFTATAANTKCDIIRLVKDSNNSKWYEVSRAMNVF